MASLNLSKVFQSIFILILISWIRCDLPANIEKCEVSNKECIIKNINLVFQYMYEGNPEFNIRKLDPVSIADFGLYEDASSVVGLKLKFSNAVTFGLRNTKVLKIKGFGKNPEGRHELLLSAPSLTFYGNYEVDGKVIILPISGEGRGNITMINPKIKLTIDAAVLKKDDKIYMDVKKTHMDVRCDRLYIDFDKLFNGDKELSKNILELINENWEPIFNDLREPVFGGINNTAFDIIHNFFDKTPYSEIFKL